MLIEKGGSPVLLISKLAQMKISSAPPSPTMPTRRRLFSLAQCQLVEGQIIQLEIASNPFSFIPRHSSDLSEPSGDHLKTRLEQLDLMFVSGSESARWYAEGVSQCVLGVAPRVDIFCGSHFGTRPCVHLEVWLSSGQLEWEAGGDLMAVHLVHSPPPTSPKYAFIFST